MRSQLSPLIYIEQYVILSILGCLDTQKRMFYFFFESRTKQSDPVVIWLTGGPGCNSELALFNENGTRNLSLTLNEFGWYKCFESYICRPTNWIGTGFSYSSDDDDIRHNEEGVINDLNDFLQLVESLVLTQIMLVFWDWVGGHYSDFPQGKSSQSCACHACFFHFP
ncbi:Serine carboxypeptidase-like 48 [Castilleja foliolosa]|uniref:Serine carboxypeptidase-like 48 n=1 Tax=Castilleja foliolosa TaxID=1961234 RepID=A0ABD3CFJ0_9LAMI